MMKNILLLVLFTLSVTSCKDYLAEENKSNVLRADYYATASGYETLVNAAYSSLREVYDMPWIFEAGTDMYVEGRNSQPEGLSKYKNLSSNDVEVMNFCASAYRAIQRCNMAIYYNDKTEAAATLNNRLGEAKFLRAFYYFLLVQNFGGVSLVQDIFDLPTLQFSRNSAEEIYAFIISEMIDARKLLGPDANATFGRVTIRAITHYLAKVYLTRGYESFAASNDFANAALEADAAIASQALTGITFENLFFPGKEKNAEVLFSVQYDKVSLKDVTTDGSTQNYWFGPYMGGEGAAKGYPYRSYTLMPTPYVYNLFTANDARWEATFMNVYYTRYYDYYDKAADRSGLNIAYYYPRTWDGDTAVWRAADKPHRGNYKVTKIIPYDSNKWVAPAGSGIDNGSPAVKKFDDPTSSFSLNGSSTRDIYLARLGETYLIAAEAYFKLGQNATAASRINEVRKRAAKPGKTANMTITASDVTINFILDERARELVGEYHRWFDLKRTGTLVSRVMKYNRDVRKLADPFTGVDGNLKILRPIPQTALDLNQNKDFAQNPGY